MPTGHTWSLIATKQVDRRSEQLPIPMFRASDDAAAPPGINDS